MKEVDNNEGKLKKIPEVGNSGVGAADSYLYNITGSEEERAKETERKQRVEEAEIGMPAKGLGIAPLGQRQATPCIIQKTAKALQRFSRRQIYLIQENPFTSPDRIDQRSFCKGKGKSWSDWWDNKSSVDPADKLAEQKSKWKEKLFQKVIGDVRRRGQE